MKHSLSDKRWWGSPRKFTTENKDRKISWLELFYDLVYVIAISTITHYLAQRFGINALLDYFYLFTIIFWGWLNGSLYYDLHGNEGLRTKLMTLWQMLIIAALVITLHSPAVRLLHNATIVLLIMQIYITYLWFSVGFYDKVHRRLNRPYTFFYLLSFALIFSTLFLRQPYIRIAFFLTLFFNYVPPFFSYYLLKRNGMELTLSSSMTERLGLFTIIIFGEVVLNVTNGVIAADDLSLNLWLQFALAMGIVFSLWWLFFTMISDRKCKPGLLNSSLFQLLFIPTLIGLGLMAAAFSHLFIKTTVTHRLNQHPPAHLPSELVIQVGSRAGIFGISIAFFMLGIWAMMSILDYPEIFHDFKRPAKNGFIVTAIVIVLFTWLPINIGLVYFLIIVLLILIGFIVYLNGIWFRMMKKQGEG
ncbi:MAG: low temperature requirement protein A [Ginsengibacter sp.]